jgi:hypothetical protein
MFTKCSWAEATMLARRLRAGRHAQSAYHLSHPTAVERSKVCVHTSAFFTKEAGVRITAAVRPVATEQWLDSFHIRFDFRAFSRGRFSVSGLISVSSKRHFASAHAARPSGYRMPTS